MKKIGDIILKANEELKEKALFPLFSIFVVDIVGTIEKIKFLEKLSKSIFNILHSILGVEIFENGESAYKFGKVEGNSSEYIFDNLKIVVYYNTISQFEENLLKYILAIAEIHYENVKKFETMKENAFYDELTGALSRKAGMELLFKKYHELKRENKIGTIVFVDLDGLKKINDTYGHLEGDKVLREFVSTVKKFIRKGDFIVRWGGDEFVIFLNGEYGEKVVKRIEKNTKTKFSWGSVNIPGSFDDVIGAINKSDKEMYRQKIIKKLN
ncbi:diguanylate cyclase [Thermosipho sp. 1063]|uniref:GGDEF domain-containing protein n=1 Tax=unclassified Thermosipho (in: thermotogales) TaxID=2676525 RepID=UPI00094949D5|nr:MULTISPECIES: GGDEF domain-containing protein [unclassified Thermosipho (in: thermotogales)]ANQ53074.1 diguanylate cyclase [Thermosipho sp. 1070]APT71523.1 diguanylate cyclase [Thermosipho sp. 1063]OOC45599.1 diguanylate cyclase [Thermosipho sp. 1074]